MKETEARLKATFPKDRTRWIVAALKHSYDVNVERYRPSIGDDGMNFGLNVYKSKVHFLASLSERFGWLKTIQATPYFRFQVGDYFLSTYCAGHSADLDLWECFPMNRNRAGRLALENAGQRTIPAVDEWKAGQRSSVDDSACRELILNDIGNPVEGLLSVFMGVPSEAAPDGSVAGWSSMLELWSPRENSMDLPSDPFGHETPPENVAKFHPSLRDRAKTESEE